MALNQNNNGVYYNVKVIDKETRNPIEDASVLFSINGSDITTNSEGMASTYFNADVDDICSCSVDAVGYQLEDGLTVPGKDRPDDYSNAVIELTPLNYYYYTIVVKDMSTGNPVPYADVCYSQLPYDNTPNRGITNRKGKFIYESNSNSRIYFWIEKNGYENSEYDSLPKGTFLPKITNSQELTFILKPTTNAKYYYTIAAKDSSGNGIPGVKVRTYDDFSFTVPRSLDIVALSDADDEIFYGLRDILAAVLNLDPENISIGDDLVNKFGVDYNDASEIIRLMDGEYNMNTSVEEFSDCNTVGDLVNFVKANCPYPYLEKTVYTTDENGLISHPSYSSKPDSIYVKGVALPSSSYTWKSETTGKLDPTLSKTSPGFTFTVSSYSSDTYYYNFKVIDMQTLKPLSDAKVTYKYNDEVLDTKMSSSDGNVKFSCSEERLYVTISKPGYVSYDAVDYSGNVSSSYIYNINLSQKHTIRVIDHLGEPAPNVYVSIFKYDKYGRKRYATAAGKYKTYSTGYIDYIGDDVYTESIKNSVYAGVLNYDKANESLLIKPLISVKNITITLTVPPEDEGVDVSDFEKFNEVSVNRIKSNISAGNVDEGDESKVTYNTKDFKINILDPDSVSTYDIFTSSPVIINNNNKSVVGSVQMDMKEDINDLRIKVLNRYSGYYNPIFKDVFFYKDLTVMDEDLHGVKCPFSNTEFDYDYKDNYGKFGVIDNMWFHKVNDDNAKIINTLNPYYPLIGQYALDKREYNIFESNWDADHYTKQLNVDTSERCTNIVSMKEGLGLFGSKYLNVPEQIEICGVTLGDGDWDGGWNDDWITNPDGCPGEVMFKEVNDNSVDFYFFFRKRILRYFRDKLKEEFESNISPHYSFGKFGIDDDIDEYVSKNVLRLYKLDKVRVFIRRTKKGQHNSKIENDYTTYLQYIPDPKTGELVELTKDNLGYFKSHGFVEINTVTMTKMNRDDFDRKLVYNLRNGCKEDFGFSFILKKI